MPKQCGGYRVIGLRWIGIMVYRPPTLKTGSEIRMAGLWVTPPLFWEGNASRIGPMKRDRVLRSAKGGTNDPSERCSNGCCHFIDGKLVTEEEYEEAIVRHPGHYPGIKPGQRNAILEAVIACRSGVKPAV
jgi:hypothetical protein